MKKLSKLMLAFMMVLGTQAPMLAPVLAAETTIVTNGLINDGTYDVIATLKKNATTDLMMGANALKENAKLEVIKGNLYATVDFQTIEVAGMKGNMINISYYNNNIIDKANLLAPQEVVLRDFEGKKIEGSVKLPVFVDANGNYGVAIQMSVDIMLKMAPDAATMNAYIQLDVKAGLRKQLQTAITTAKSYAENAYTPTSFQALQTAIENAQATIDGNKTEKEISDAYNALQAAIKVLVKVQEKITLADGSYNVPFDVLKTDGASQSMAAAALKDVVLDVKNNEIMVSLTIAPIEKYGQTAYINKIEYEDGNTWKQASITAKDANDNITGMQFVLPVNTKRTNIKFYYGENNSAQAVLYLDLDSATKISNSKFAQDGTYEVMIDLWNATQDKPSMASPALVKKAIVTVKDGKKTMYISTNMMTLGTISAYLQELKISNKTSFEVASVYKKDKDGNPTMLAFTLPNEENFLEVLVNPHVAIMGNQDIAARIKVDYTSLKKLSDEIQAPATTIPITPSLPATWNEDTNNSVKDEPKKDTIVNTSTKKPTTTTSTNKTSSVKTGDTTNLGLIGGFLILSGVVLLLSLKKKLCKK